MLSLKPHHLGWAVKDLDAGTAALQNLGYIPVPELPDALDENFHVWLRFVRHPENSLLIEFVAPADPNNPVNNSLKKNGPGLYHVGYSVENIRETAVALKQLGFCPATKILPAPAFGGKEIQFFQHRQLGLIELVASV